MSNDDNHPYIFVIRNPGSKHSTPRPTEKQLRQGKARSRIEQIKEQQELDTLLAEL